ncbi:MAG: hypothetical protein PHO15_08655 [Eubacteriales bacterium]|nr:hypothetical protein [Eubacteriales bacterium]
MSATVKQCKQCGQLFQSYGASECSVCLEEMDRGFILVKEYIYDHPDANVVEISNETGISEKIILHFLKEGRLSIETSDCLLTCEKCGKRIKSGRFCHACKTALENTFKSMCGSADEEQKTNASASGLGKMHFEYKKEQF